MSVCRPCAVRQESVLARMQSVVCPLGVRIMPVSRPCPELPLPQLATNRTPSYTYCNM
jgi:hypothetical protein